MSIQKPTKELVQALRSHDAAALREARELAETLTMAAFSLTNCTAALVQLCQQLHPKAGPADAVKLVHAQVKDLPSSVAAFKEQWHAVAQDLLHVTRFLRQAAIERDDQIGSELLQLNAKLGAESAQSKAKRKALTDAGVTADEAARLSPEPSDTAHAEQSAALQAERAILSKFGRTLDGSMLPPSAHDRAKQLEAQKDLRIDTRQRVGA